VQSLWFGVLGALLAGWFVLDGVVLGAGMVGPWLAPRRRSVRTAVGPLLLGSEMWLIAASGIVLAVFPTLETAVSRCYPIVTLMVAAWMLRDAALWLGRRAGDGRRWDYLWLGASAVFSYCAGALLGVLAHGVPNGSVPSGTLFGPVAVLAGLTAVAVHAGHGAMYLLLRVPEIRDRRSAAPTRLLIAALAVAVLAIAVGMADTTVRDALSQAGLLVVLAPVALAVALGCHLRGHPGWAFGCTVAAVVAGVGGVGLGLSDTVRSAAVASAPVAYVILPALPVVAGYQVWMWWLFRGSVGRRSVVFF
jgi:cytochrome d ubiquinol oxidase subunit II